MKSRADRLFQERKKKSRVKRMVSEVWGEPKLAEDPKFVGRMAHTVHPCSGRCCGNPRKWYGEKTLQEKKEEFKESTNKNDISEE